MGEDEYISHEVFMSEYANDDFWGRTPYLIGVHDGMIFAYEIIKKTIDSGTTPDPKIINENIENALKQKNMLEKELCGEEKEKVEE